MKGVSLILQFVLFFTIGFTFFLLAGNLFRFQSGLIRQDIIDLGSQLQSSKISALSIQAVTSCKFCDTVKVELQPQIIGGYYPIYQLSNGVVLKIEPANKNLQSSMHNFHYSITYDTNDVSSVKTIALTYDRTNNKLVMR